MSRVLVVGATGLIGQRIAHHLLRSGNYTVYGLARTEEKATGLAAQEIIPIIGSGTDTATITKHLTEKWINLVINAAELGPDAKILLDAVKEYGATQLAHAEKVGVRAQKVGYIYISGTWVHGSTHQPLNDLDLVGVEGTPVQHCELVTYRPVVERDILASHEVLDVAVARPGLVYGGNNWIFNTYFGAIHEAAKNGESSLDLPLEPDSHPGIVHCDDVGSGVLALADKLPLLAGTGVYPIFDFVTSQESFRSILEAAARHLGFNGSLNLKGHGGHQFMEALGTTQNVSSGRAKSLLGWEPKRIGMLQGMEVFVMSWLAGQK